MEAIAPFITALTTAISILSVLWVVRRTGQVNSVHFIFGIGVIIYTLYHFYACGVLGIIAPAHSSITGLFISSVAIVNAYCSTCNAGDVNIGVCRRKDPGDGIIVDRRKVSSHTIFKDVAKP